MNTLTDPQVIYSVAAILALFAVFAAYHVGYNRGQRQATEFWLSVQLGEAVSGRQEREIIHGTDEVDRIIAEGE